MRIDSMIGEAMCPECDKAITSHSGPQVDRCLTLVNMRVRAEWEASQARRAAEERANSEAMEIGRFIMNGGSMIVHWPKRRAWSAAINGRSADGETPLEAIRACSL